MRFASTIGKITKELNTVHFYHLAAMGTFPRAWQKIDYKSIETLYAGLQILRI